MRAAVNHHAFLMVKIFTHKLTVCPAIIPPYVHIIWLKTVPVSILKQIDSVSL